jgi:hypothetical protein
MLMLMLMALVLKVNLILEYVVRLLGSRNSFWRHSNDRTRSNIIHKGRRWNAVSRDISSL